jgi:hypothetical protein
MKKKSHRVSYTYVLEDRFSLARERSLPGSNGDEFMRSCGASLLLFSAIFCSGVYERCCLHPSFPNEAMSCRVAACGQ